jgi:hypothetical protein
MSTSVRAGPELCATVLSIGDGDTTRVGRKQIQLIPLGAAEEE